MLSEHPRPKVLLCKKKVAFCGVISFNPDMFPKIKKKLFPGLLQCHKPRSSTYSTPECSYSMK